MTNKLIKAGVVCLLSSCAFISAAQAGGWNRGEADTDILFEDGDYAVRAGATYVSPRRTFATINGAASTDDRYSADYWIPSVAAKLKVMDNFACAFTYTQSFGANAEYGAAAQAASATGVQQKEFVTNEYGATCDVSMDAGKGRLHFLGGVFLQDFSYTAVSAVGTLQLDDSAAYGYRIGAAYEITEYALRAQIMYRSQVEHETDSGSFDFATLPFDGPASGSGTLPQSLKLSLQSGVAPGWLVYGSVKWTDWSVMDALNYTIPVLGAQQDVYNWRDGWTIQAGVGHAFNEKIAGTINLTWDRGVGTGADIYSDSWTIGVGASVKAGPGEFRFGGGVSYLTEGSQSTAKQASYDATANGDWAYAFSGSYRIKF